MDYKSKLSENNTELQEILDTINALPVASSGTDNSEIEEMLLSTDDNYDAAGNQFYSVHKWVDISHTNFSSFPVVFTAINHHPTLWVHLYIEVENYDENYAYSPLYHTLTVAPADGENSIEIEGGLNPVSVYIEGMRWSEDGV